jgi:hypothetical protein
MSGCSSARLRRLCHASHAFEASHPAASLFQHRKSTTASASSNVTAHSSEHTQAHGGRRRAPSALFAGGRRHRSSALPASRRPCPRSRGGVGGASGLSPGTTGCGRGCACVQHTGWRRCVYGGGEVRPGSPSLNYLHFSSHLCHVPHPDPRSPSLSL